MKTRKTNKIVVGGMKIDDPVKSWVQPSVFTSISAVCFDHGALSHNLQDLLKLLALRASMRLQSGKEYSFLVAVSRSSFRGYIKRRIFTQRLGSVIDREEGKQRRVHKNIIQGDPLLSCPV